jgi:hypothetical protein
VGETLPGENPGPAGDAEYLGEFFQKTLSVLIAGSHPDQALYLYQVAKAILIAGRPALHRAGLLGVRISGGELAPEETYLPDNAFTRVLTLSFHVMETIPRLFPHRDGRRLQTGGIFSSEINVGGVRGGVHSVPED